MRTPQLDTTRTLLVLTVLLSLAASACASRTTVASKNQIATARYAIREAESSQAGIYAEAELATARAKLEEARDATPDVGLRLAEEATVNAQLASAISAREAARAQLAEARRVQRKSGTLRVETTEAVEERSQQ
jgi:hypothetical protein